MFQPPPPPADSDGLMRVSDFHRYLENAPHDGDSSGTRLSSLNPSLMQDLIRFERSHPPGDGLEVLEVLAAATRHGRAVLIHMQLDYRVIPLTVFPLDRLAHIPIRMPKLLEMRLPDLRVLHVEPARLRPLGDPDPSRIGLPAHYARLSPLLWELALRGAREALLPEIAGSAAYRIAPGADLGELDLTGSLADAVIRLRRDSANLTEIAGWPGFDRERAMRLLNGLYLQAALMISRTHPAAANPDWRSEPP
jgi:hypothetical protein